MSARPVGPFKLSVGEVEVVGRVTPQGRVVEFVNEGRVIFVAYAATASAVGIALQAVAACAEHAPEPGR